MIADAVWAEDARTQHGLDPAGARRVRRHDRRGARSPRRRRASRSAPPSCRCSRATRSRWCSSRCRPSSSPRAGSRSGSARRTTGSSRTCSGCRTNAPPRSTADYLDVLDAAMAGPGAGRRGERHASDPQPDVRHRRAAHAGAARRARAGDAASSPASRTDGTILWLADEKAIESHIAPRITAAATEAGRPAPRIVAGVPVCLCLPERGRRGEGPRRPGAQRGDRVAELPAPARPGRRDRACPTSSPPATRTMIRTRLAVVRGGRRHRRLGARPADRRRPRRTPRVEPPHPRVRRRARWPTSPCRSERPDSTCNRSAPLRE